MYQVVVIGDPAQPSRLTKAALEARLGKSVSTLAFDWTFAPPRTFSEAALKAERGLETPIPALWRAPLKEAEIVVTHFFPIRSRMLSAAPNLSVIATLRHGEGNIDKAAARERSIKVINNPGREAEAVSDFTIGLIIDAVRGLTRSAKALTHGRWMSPAEAAPHSRDMKDLTVGIIGYGYVGRLVRKKLAGFECRVLIHDPNVADAEIERDGAMAVPLGRLLGEADIVTIHVRLSPETNGLIGATELALMRPSAYLINTARAELVEEQAVATALSKHAIAGAALDVFWREPASPDSPLLAMLNVIVTPHLAGSTADAQANSAMKLADRLARVLKEANLRSVASISGEP